MKANKSVSSNNRKIKATTPTNIILGTIQFNNQRCEDSYKSFVYTELIKDSNNKKIITGTKRTWKCKDAHSTYIKLGQETKYLKKLIKGVN